MKPLNKIAAISLTLILSIVILTGCTGTQSATVQNTTNKAKPVTLTISVAASLKDAMGEIKDLYAKAYPNVKLTINFGGSGTLQQQIEQGAPVDLFISAGKKQMDALETKSLIVNNTRKDLLSNKLVLIIPATAGNVTGFKDLTKADVKKVAIGDPASVPCGSYAEKAFTSMGIAGKVKNKLILGKDVTQVLTYVESGNVDAGIVYLSDTKNSSKVKVVDTAAESTYGKILYPEAVIKAGKNQAAAKEFEAFLSGNQAKAVFKKYSFIMPGK